MKVTIEMASASRTYRDDIDPNNTEWKPVAIGEDWENALMNFAEAFNNEETPDSNNWLRIRHGNNIYNC